METNNLDVIKQAVLYTKQNNLVYKKVYASPPSTYPYLAIKVISVDYTKIDINELKQDEGYYVTTFLSDGTEDWNAWRNALTAKDWAILSATETKQKGTKKTSMIPKASDYKTKTEFLNTEVSRERPTIRPIPFFPGIGFSGISSPPRYQAVQGELKEDYKGVKLVPGPPDASGTAGPDVLGRSYSAPFKSSNMIQNYFFNLGDNQKIILGWSGGDFTEWWEDKYTMSAVKESGEMDNLESEDNPAAVATFNQVVPTKNIYSDPNFLQFYRDKKEEFKSNTDEKKGSFTLPLPTEDELLMYGFQGKTFYELGLEDRLSQQEVDVETINGLIKKLMGQIKNEQSIDEIEKNREKALKSELERGEKSQKAVGTGANILLNLFGADPNEVKRRSSF
jgi:hypothetical protein